MNQFSEVLDEIQITTPNSSGIEQQPQQQQSPRQSNPTIISKFRYNFLPNPRQLTSRSINLSSSSSYSFLFFFFSKINHQKQVLFNHLKNQQQVIKSY